MLNRYVTEDMPTSRITKLVNVPAVPPKKQQHDVADTTEGADVFGSTTVIPSDFLTDNSADSRVQVGSVLRDRFMLQQKISGGSMGVVYKALDRRLAEAGSNEHWVAIKVLSPQLAKSGEALRALQQEAAKGRCLVHPNIVRFIDIDRDDDLYFLVMEWLDGRTLADILDSPDARIIDLEAAFRIVRQIADALDYAHRCGIVHADVKPGNIMIMPNGDAKLFDFGVARVRQKHFNRPAANLKKARSCGVDQMGLAGRAKSGQCLENLQLGVGWNTGSYAKRVERCLDGLSKRGTCFWFEFRHAADVFNNIRA